MPRPVHFEIHVEDTEGNLLGLMQSDEPAA